MRLKLSPAAPAAEVANLLLWGEPLQEPPGLSLSLRAGLTTPALRKSDGRR
jgi:hypothetical protein